MKKVVLDLTDYEFEGRDDTGKLTQMKVSMKEELSVLLRINGVYDNGIEMCDGVDIAKQVKYCKEDALTLSETEHNLVKKVLDKLIKDERFQPRFGGIRYEELIFRVFKAKINGSHAET